MPKDHLNCGNVASRTALLCTAVATFCWSAPAHGQTSRGDRKLIAFTKCTLLYMGEAYCQRELEKHLGRTLGGLTCAAYIQKTFEGRIDLSDIGWGLLADKATSSKSGWIRLGGLIGKGLLFRKCYRQTLAELEDVSTPQRRSTYTPPRSISRGYSASSSYTPSLRRRYRDWPKKRKSWVNFTAGYSYVLPLEVSLDDGDIASVDMGSAFHLRYFGRIGFKYVGLQLRAGLLTNFDQFSQVELGAALEVPLIPRRGASLSFFAGPMLSLVSYGDGMSFEHKGEIYELGGGGRARALRACSVSTSASACSESSLSFPSITPAS